MAVGNYVAAARYFETAIRANVDFAEAHFSLAGSLSKIPGRVPDAIKEYEAALQLRPNEGLVRMVHAKLGMLLADLGRNKEAIAHLEEVQRIHPEDREATEKARSYFGGPPPTSPAIAILRDGQLVYLMQRSAIETSTAPAIAQEMTRAFDTYCAPTTA